jgi:helix-turn-helix protein
MVAARPVTPGMGQDSYKSPKGGRPMPDTMHDTEERWYRVADVVRRVNISEQAVRAAISSGHLKVVRPGGLRRGRFSMIRIPASAVTAWLCSSQEDT